MKVITKFMPRDYNLYISSDIHLGSNCISEDALKEMVNECKKDRKGYMTNIGDNIEAIAPNDKRFALSSNPYQSSHEQADAFIEIFKPIANKILAIGLGNHEYKLYNTLQVDRYIAQALGVDYGTYSYKLVMKDKNTQELMHKFHFWHGAGHIGSMAKDKIQADGNMKAALKKKLSNIGHGDCIAHFMGHIHKFLIVNPTVNDDLYLTTDELGRIKQHYKHHENQAADFIPPDARWYVANGSFMKSFSTDTDYISYAEVAGYSPAEIGYVKAIIRDGNLVDIERVLK